jgi:hypothetical protein
VKLVACLTAVCVLTGQAAAQLRGEARADFFFAKWSAIQLGGGLSRPVGDYVYLSIVAGGGLLLSNEAGRPSARVEGLATVPLDPAGTRRWNPYLSGGLGARFDDGHGWRGVVSLLVGVEARKRPDASVTPFAELGYGGGARLSAGLRSPIRRRG